ncbi:MAG: ABC transporter ATP-binding protein [Fulvimarina manganoxydans]|uniref:ABC transporter ATP-binding protein n=1 Tax=Fulvimarina manganoxydans TaxID=937218 RepID=UPI0023537CC0|nr:ATP-binding cassette domain-containing protein [Fulvimarina manganoxydans]MCK5931956.1 ABC transporter ATP-binding protein [Fulvimarina manganoxydans]
MSLDVKDLVVMAGKTQLLGPLDVAVEPGEPLSILGETGAGKSLLAQAVMGTLPAGLSASGRITLGGRRLDDLPASEREALWGRHVAILPQEPWRALDPLMRGNEQVAESHAVVAGRPWDEARRRAEGDLSGLGLPGASHDAYPGVLSGGMAQRVAFAAATAAGATTLLADEPTKGLDDARRDDVVRLLRDVAEKGGILLCITHDVAVARALGGRVMILRQGEVVECGACETVLTAPQSAYGRALVEADPANWPSHGTMPGQSPVLVAENLSIARGGRTLVSGIDLSVGTGGRLAIAGPSGLGKSTLLDTLAGLIPPARGRVERRGEARKPLALQKLYQDPPSAFAPRVTLKTGFQDLVRRHRLDAARMSMLIERLGLSPALLERKPSAVSGGELQRLALARVLMLNPSVILADEPTSRLDPVTQRSVMEVIGEIHHEAEAAVILVTHNLTLAKRWAGTVVNLATLAAAKSAA